MREKMSTSVLESKTTLVFSTVLLVILSFVVYKLYKDMKEGVVVYPPPQSPSPGVTPPGSTPPGTTPPSPAPSPTPPSGPPTKDAVHELLCIYGQSLSIGSRGTPAISTEQYYSNLSFNTGPRANKSSPLVLHTEQNSGKYGETCNFSAAATAVDLQLRRKAINYHQELVMISLAPGEGGKTAKQLGVGSPKYDKMKSRINSVKKSYPKVKASVFIYVQGESDASNETSPESYTNSVMDIFNGFKKITNSPDCKMITYQTSADLVLSNKAAQIAVEQLKWHEEGKSYMTTPAYPFEHADKFHLTATGYIHMGAYFGRAFDYVKLGKKPPCLCPLSMSSNQKTAMVKFNVPVLPLKMGNNTDHHGFRVILSDGTDAIIEGFNIVGDTVHLKCDKDIASGAEIRYGLDYVYGPKTIYDGDDQYASVNSGGDLSDSDKTKVTVSGVDVTMINYAVAFSKHLV